MCTNPPVLNSTNTSPYCSPNNVHVSTFQHTPTPSHCSPSWKLERTQTHRDPPEREMPHPPTTTLDHQSPHYRARLYLCIPCTTLTGLCIIVLVGCVVCIIRAHHSPHYCPLHRNVIAQSAPGKNIFPHEMQGIACIPHSNSSTWEKSLSSCDARNCPGYISLTVFHGKIFFHTMQGIAWISNSFWILMYWPVYQTLCYWAHLFYFII